MFPPEILLLPSSCGCERGINAADIRARAIARATQEAAHDADPENFSPPPPAPAQPSVGRSRRSANSASATPAVAESSASGEASPSVTVQTKGKGKGKGKGKKRKKADSDAEDDNDDYNPYSKSIPVPGQIAFCAECESRFTVTAYSKASEDGDGLLCTKCGKKYAKEEKEVKKKRSTGKRVKRDVLRQALDGETLGPKSLKEYCIRLIAKHIDDVEALGDIAMRDMDRIGQIISRNRSLNNNTIRLLLEPQGDRLNLYDCARVDATQLRNIGAFVPRLKHLSLHHAGRMTDEVISYYAEKLTFLESLHIRGAFLISRQAYIDFFEFVGHRLKSLTLAATARTNQAVIEAIVNFCPNIESLNLSSLARFDDDCLRLLTKCTQLKSLDISFAGGEITDEAIVEVLNVIGSGLKELNLSGNPSITTLTTSAIHACCAHLRVLNLSECELLTDSDIINLFTNWRKNHGLYELHLARLTELTNAGLLAAVQHSGQTLEVLDVNSCASINKDGLMSALKSCKKLVKFDVAFVREVDDEVVEAMQDIGIKGLVVWGCTRVTEVCRIDQGVSLVGREADIAAC
ncbi:hypothetical protein BDD12DRAFT_897422 [Trichophaea hybrida]|nr:hypothetical protein BDD12DRAFT_897422 [Trichophaea hybrida]